MLAVGWSRALSMWRDAEPEKKVSRAPTLTLTYTDPNASSNPHPTLSPTPTPTLTLTTTLSPTLTPTLTPP